MGQFTKRIGVTTRAEFDARRDTLSHRGPDQAATFEDRGVLLGFRRLAILDLSPAGHQPMTSADGRYIIVFNGEIYNFEELRAALVREGAVFRSRSDTEVLLTLFAREGTDCLRRLNGMFAFAIHDTVTRRITLARDRLGVKPLFFHRTADSFAFGSELRAMRGAPGVPDDIDADALAIFLRIGMVPDWTSIHPGVRKLPPGHWIQVDLDGPGNEAPVRYWDLPASVEFDERRSEQDWTDEIEALLWDATRIRLRADVPLGVFLSGGIDSGLVAAAAAKQVDGLSCFTVGFTGEAEDETPLARATAAKLGVRVVGLDVDLARGMDQLPGVMAHFDEPFSDTSALPTALICAEARKHLVVVLTGDAGDEVFGGYTNHVRAGRWRALDAVPAALRGAAGAVLGSLAPPDSVARRFARRLGEPVGRFGMGAMLYPFEDWPDRVLKPEFRVRPDALIERYSTGAGDWPGADAVDRSQRTDLRTYMLDDILVKVDRMSMRHSLELRSPFLDYRMVELGLRVPPRLRVKDGRNKHLLRVLAERHLPPEVCAAPKRGFGIPLASWLRDPDVATRTRQRLIEPSGGAPDPFVSGGAARLWEEAQRNPAMRSALVRALGYRWWAGARVAP